MPQPGARFAQRISICCAAIILALYVVGLVSGTEIRHIVQTAPLWLGVLLGWRSSAAARWIALPFFLFWLAIMVFIWLFLLGWAHIVSGHFSPTEVAMTIVIGIASVSGITAAGRAKMYAPPLAAAGVFVLGAFLQLAAFRLSMLPQIARR